MIRRSVPLLAIFCILSLGLVSFGRAQPVLLRIDTDASTLSYTGHHTLHSWTGVSTAVQGTLHVDSEDPSQSTVQIRVPVDSFHSGKVNRDSNMETVMEVERYPYVTFESTQIDISSWESSGSEYKGVWEMTGDLTMHGRTQSRQVEVRVRIEDRTLRAETSFQIQLSNFDVRRPRLLLIPIDDTIDIEAEIVAISPPSEGVP